MSALQPPISVPKTYYQFWDGWENSRLRQQYLNAYQSGIYSFIPNLLPEQAIHLTTPETLAILRARLNQAVDIALDPRYTDPNNRPAELPQAIRSPVATQPDASWLKQTNMVGINVRTLGSFWNIVKYSLTVPQAQDSIHLLPILEPGVVGSLYGMSSWNLNSEFYSDDLAATLPHLDTVEKQLRAVIHLLHAMGRTVGMDVIPHTDRFSEIALAYPEYFEWLQREDVTIVDHRADLHEDVQARIIDFLQRHGPAVEGLNIPSSFNLFSSTVNERTRLQILFGQPNDYAGRQQRRVALVAHLVRHGYEPVPATMAPPYRGLAVDSRQEVKKVDENGLIWRDYIISQPEPMSRVFSPLGRYKLYERLNDNREWEIDFSQPRLETWAYICQKYYEMQQRYGFDFMRGDMSHIQMRPTGVPAQPDAYYDLLGAIKRYIQQDQGVAYFGYFAETFIAPRNVIAYGDEIDHLEAAKAETTLGDLQSLVVGSPEFMHQFRHYYDLLTTRQVAPNFTVMTADKDDPRFDNFYLKGNAFRLFTAMFLGDMPTYMGLGFEVRDSHPTPAPNEHYTKLYVFQETAGPKGTHGPYVWGKNGALYNVVSRLKLYLERMQPPLQGRPTRWLIPPNLNPHDRMIAWTQANEPPDYLFIANADVDHPAVDFTIPIISLPLARFELKCEFSTHTTMPQVDQTLISYGTSYKVAQLAPGEGRVYHIARDA